MHKSSAYLSVKIPAWGGRGASDSQDLGYRHTRRAKGLKFCVHIRTQQLCFKLIHDAWVAVNQQTVTERRSLW